jgi:two-component system OmpR family sensor kinase
MPSVATDRYLATLQRLLELPAGDLQTALTHATNALAEALQADKVDAFLYDERRDSLVAVGTSTQPLSNLQKKLGLDVLPLSNGGRVVYVYKTGEVFRTGDLQQDPEELKGIKEGLKIHSKLGVPLRVDGQLRGMVMVASLKMDFFSEADETFARSAVGWVGMVTHRSELVRNIEEAAVQQGRTTAAEEIITVLAHDIRNYVAPVSLRLYTLRRRAEMDQRLEYVEDVNVALRGVARLNGLVANLLDVARLDRGLFDLDTEPVDLAAIAKEAASLLSTADNPIVVKSSDAVIVIADRARIRQCLENLLGNAVRHSPRNAPVSVFISRLNEDGREWGQMQVIDEGPGIAEEIRPHIFERFVSGRGQKAGLGLGLYLAQRIATSHGGQLTADQAPGKGARFVIKLPLLNER